MTFAHPTLLLVALAALVAIALGYRALERRRTAQAYAFSDLAFALHAMRPARWPAAMLFASFLVGAGALMIAGAGPHLVTRVPAKDATVVICVDTSGSMRARDVAPTRADAARAAARAFVDAVPDGTRVGIVTFSSGASLIAPPTSDRDIVRDALDRLPAPDGATAIGDALQLAAQQMPASGRRIVVLLTDGINNRGSDPVAQSQAIGARGVTIEAVGVGTSGSGEIIPGTREAAELDAVALASVARNAHGRYVEARDASSLAAAFRQIALATVWEKKRVDASLPMALGGGIVLVTTLLGALAAGRF
ncbi:MAG: VWA domain-containing protein [Vulcanimicrobiaceae bacterium]